MDHSAHAHAAHEMAMPMRCKMNMLWNTDIIDTCIVFRSWHVTSTSFFLGSCIAIVLLGVLYEYLRVFQRRLDVHIALALQNQSKGKTGRGRERESSRGSGSGGGNGAGTPRLASASPEGDYAHDHDHEESGLLSGRRLIVKSLAGVPVPPVTRALRAAVYGATVFLSFFLMLVFMTYNAYLIAAVVVGAALGHYVFGSTINVDAILAETASGKGMACH
ncbi:hypothetical protein GALMADRAFT_258239 [Galerina marginata CBS 339.88]|uniref:Copper transport protein n=1 Tax=Galerina marginata (strain CBS 339.88) TaxID=685588 RepID=A0A067S9I9_GALM3|nr:hypothetical protein GALMADRAFT_258239 [Galerina marginata CBS 339.88]